ncbi:TonB-dependent receptor plug domain-containing protein [Mucilaginibacter sp. UR6-1]|uniref:carboxypeptidase-like regulatory domain-containing protein n=1 Tax=Mucilaginibacter sp. UR6-1 TaxID=1435643 RepID=UPI001E5F7045|nr:carboxypeptidase-like regulatory domain-containing protein [Mucilaginibacter sp. UR6-1]MCC8409519.1 TonB-dependent receptor plug domain-containing protein [Mucilaginibacter sp. UR6-1]
MKFKPLILSLLAACSLSVGFIIADDPVQKIVESLEQWLVQRPQEKVYLHFDKPYYAVGDTLWYKAYVTVGEDHRLSALSGILTVELVNDRDSVRRRERISLTSGLGWGDFILSDSLLESGSYRIRAYTNWMRNAGEEYFFDKTITIGKAMSNKVFTNTTYSYAAVNGQQQVTATINYREFDGSPYADREVIYRVVSDGKIIAKGKGVTNAEGNVKISFDVKAPGTFKPGNLITTISIDNKEKVTKSIPLKAVANTVDVQFFPESGYLVNGLTSKVAFKATGADGLGKEVKGVVKDGQGNTVASFATEHLGMGAFTFTPAAGKTYKASLTFADGSVKDVDMPAMRTSGYVMNINNNNPAVLVFKITSAGTAAQDLILVAQAGGKVRYAAKPKGADTAFTAVIPKTRLTSGIVQFTLFSATGEPLNERLAFIQKADDLKIKLSPSKQDYATREKVSLGIEGRFSADSAGVSNLSMSVIDESKVKVDEDEENSIFASILLTSDLKGYVEKPNYYFHDVSDKTRADLDLLMLTQGYRRFEWKQLLAGNMGPMIYKPEQTIDIAGTVTQSKKPVAGAKIMLFNNTNKGRPFMIDTVADANGHFVFKGLIFTDSLKFMVQATTPKGKRYVDVKLDADPRQSVTISKNRADVAVNVDGDMMGYLRQSTAYFNEKVKYGIASRNNLLNEVKITSRREPVVKHSSNLNGAGNADQVITAKDLQACSTLEQCLQGRLVGVMFRNGIPYTTRGGGQMTVLIDGMAQGDDALRNITPFDVETVEVLRSGGKSAIYGFQGANGVIIITTKRGDGGFKSSYDGNPPGVVMYTPLGYYVSRAFYSPKYDVPDKNTNMADMRSTIYWNPNIYCDGKTPAEVSYFNADGKGSYRVVVEGIDDAGHIGRQVYRYKVQ